MILLTPDNVVGYEKLGRSHYYLRHFEDAVTAWQHALEIDSSYTAAYARLGTYYYWVAQDYTAAARQYERALVLRNTDYQVWGYLATAYHWTEDERHKAPAAWRRQIELAEARLEVHPRNSDVLVRLAYAYAQLGQREQALAFVERVIAEEPEEPGPLALIGIVYEILHEREDALAWIAKALNNRLPPEFIEADPWLHAFRADPNYPSLLPEEGPSAR